MTKGFSASKRRRPILPVSVWSAFRPHASAKCSLSIWNWRTVPTYAWLRRYRQQGLEGLVKSGFGGPSGLVGSPC